MVTAFYEVFGSMVFFPVDNDFVVESSLLHQTFKKLKVTILFNDGNFFGTVFWVTDRNLIRLRIKIDDVDKSVEREVFLRIERIFREII